jgi:hypothetical protein
MADDAFGKVCQSVEITRTPRNSKQSIWQKSWLEMLPEWAGLADSSNTTKKKAPRFGDLRASNIRAQTVE